MSDLLQERVSHALEALRLTTANANLAHHLEHARERDLPALSVLDALLADELAARRERSMIVRTKLAHFPAIKTFESFELDAQPSLDRRLIHELQTLAFLDRADGVALLGPPGVGKTHIAIALGMKALEAGVRVYFLTAQDLIDQIRAAQLEGIPGHKQRHLCNVPLLIIDEVGYLQFDKSAATWLYQLMCQRYEQHSTIITSNKAFAEWGEIFGDVVLAGALLDRFVHHCHVVSIKGESYRMRSRKRGAGTTKDQTPAPGGSALKRR